MIIVVATLKKSRMSPSNHYSATSKKYVFHSRDPKDISAPYTQRLKMCGSKNILNSMLNPNVIERMVMISPQGESYKRH